MSNKDIPRENYQNPVGKSPFVYAGYACNNNCVFCFEKDNKPVKKTTKELKTEIEIIRQNYDFINFMGQEPTLRKDIIELVKYAKQLKFKQVGITTNGRMFAYGKFSKQILLNLNQVVVTVVGSDSEVHDWHTGSENSFNQTVEGIKRIINFKNGQVSLVINLMITNKNYKKLLEIVDFYYKLGVREMNIGHILPYNRLINQSKKIIAKMSNVTPYLIKIYEKYNKTIKFLFVEYPACVFPEHYKHLSFPCLEENYNKIRIDLCSKCLYSKSCVGVPKDYIKLYGQSEFFID